MSDHTHEQIEQWANAAGITFITECADKATRCEQEAQRAIEAGEHDEVSAIRSTAWQISVCAAAIRARGAQGEAHADQA